MNEPLPDFALAQPVKVEQAVAFAQAAPTSRFLAGGTDLMVNLRRGLADGADLIDLSAIEELRRFEVNADGVTIGACVTLRELTERSDELGPFSTIAQAALAVAGPGHRTAATVAGNLCVDTRCIYYNQSRWWRNAVGYCLKYKGEICHVAPAGKRCRAAYSGDLAPALLVHGATIELANSKGRRRIALDNLFREDGADHLQLVPGELVVAVHVPLPEPETTTRSAYEKVRTRGAIDFPLAGAAVLCCRRADGSLNFSVAITGTNSQPFLVEGLEPVGSDAELAPMLEHLEKLVQKQASPQRTTSTAAHYRRLAISAVAKRLAARLAAELQAK